LENQLDFRLFDRTTRQVVLTDYGNELLAVTQRNLQEIDSAMSGIGRTAKGSNQSLSLGTTPLVAANILPQAIREFRSQRPELRIQLVDDDLTAILKKVEPASSISAWASLRASPACGAHHFFVSL
jgi:DNA-binding transcriptional LysR family regulator